MLLNRQVNHWYKLKRNGPKIELWGTPTLMCDQLHDWPLRTTSWWLLFWMDVSAICNFHWYLKSLAYTLNHDGLMNKFKFLGICQTLSKVFDRYTKTPLASNDRFASNSLSILCIIDDSWCKQESPGQKPDWLLVKRFL